LERLPPHNIVCRGAGRRPPCIEVAYGGRRGEPVSSTVSVDDHLQACWSSSGAAEFGGGRLPNLVWRRLAAAAAH